MKRYLTNKEIITSWKMRMAALGIFQSDIARILETSQSTISLYVSGKGDPNASVVDAIEKYIRSREKVAYSRKTN